MQPTTYELKYCERCGALGTRRSATTGNYCESCAQIMARNSLPGVAEWRPQLRRRSSRPRLPQGLKAEAACGGLQ